MTTWRRSRFTAAWTLGFGAAWLVWTLLLPLVSGVDAWWHRPPLASDTPLAEIAIAVAVLTTPALVYPALLAVAFWASRRQLNSLAAALLLAVALSFGAAQVVKEAVARPRPPSPWDHLLTSHGLSYPSGHVTAMTTAAVMVIVLARVARRSRGAILAARVLGPLLVVVVALDRMLLGVHHVSDVVGGLLLGGFAASAACLICGVHLPARSAPRRRAARGRAAVVYNPTKIVDLNVFRDLVRRRLAEAGWEPPIWLPTAATDPGRAMARAALESEVDLVLVAGGDGTVRVVAGELAGSGTRAALIPSGTGNLLARNLGIPLDMGRALDVALAGRDGAIDVLRVRVPGRDPDHAVVMCGVGADAAVLNDTDENLKRQIGIGAYVVAALGHIRTRPVRTTVTIDDGEPLVRDSSLTMVCNVSDLQAGLRLAPGASAMDGILDVLVASPSGQTELAQLVAAVLSQSATPDTLELRTGRRVRIGLATEQLYQLDGDVEGTAGELDFEVLPGALRLRLPPE